MDAVILSDYEVNDILNKQDKEIESLKKENEQLKQQLTSILKLINKIEDYTHDIKIIGDV